MTKIRIKSSHLLLLGILALFLSFCSSTSNNVKFAGDSLEKAKNNQGPEFAQSDYSQAETDYKNAESYMKQEKSDDAQKMADSSLKKSRTSIITGKDKRAKQAIDNSDAIIKQLTQVSLDQGKDISTETQNKLEIMKQIKPAQTLLDEAKKHYQNATKIAEDYKKNLQVYEAVKEENSYIEEMDKAYEKAKKAEAMLQEEYNKYLAKNQKQEPSSKDAEKDQEQKSSIISSPSSLQHVKILMELKNK